MLPAISLGTMTFGEQVNAQTAHSMMDRALERGVNAMDTAEMYAVPPRAETYGKTEEIIGQYFATHPGKRANWQVASKIAGPGRMAYIRGGTGDMSAAAFELACHDSLRRLHTDYLDLYYIHWPSRHVPMFGGLYFDRSKLAERAPIADMHAQLEGLTRLVRAGKVRTIGLSNETPWGVMHFLRLAREHGLEHICCVQNAYCLSNRVPDNGLDEVLQHEGLALLAYSPLGYSALSGKYNAMGLDAANTPPGRIADYPSVRVQRWARPEALEAARRYGALAQKHGFSLVQLALGFVYHSPKVTSTIIGASTMAQLDENLDAWGVQLSAEILAEIDAIRWQLRDPAQ
jgi:aryl-alcohol dehydrogenase-like predicted oxidoreductase